MQWSLYAGNKKHVTSFKWLLVALNRWSLYREKFDLKSYGRTTTWSLRADGSFKKVFVKTILTVDDKSNAGKYLYRSPCFNEAACIFNKKRLRHRCFPLNFEIKIFRTLILQNIYEGLLLRLALLCLNKNAIFDPDKKKSKSERLCKWKFFCREFLKLVVNILFANMQPGVFSNGLPMWKAENYISYSILISELFFLRHQMLMQPMRNDRSRESFLKFFFLKVLSRLSQVTAMIANNFVPVNWTSFV